VLASVVSRHGDRIVVDAGRKALSTDVGTPAIDVCDDVVRSEFHEEHSVMELRGTTLRPGDLIRIAPAYAPTTVNLYDAFHVVSGDTVVDLWPIGSRYTT
jgi:D-serine deaminase-like pyridoxal phosphate-dependent protein